MLAISSTRARLFNLQRSRGGGLQALAMCRRMATRICPNPSCRRKSRDGRTAVESVRQTHCRWQRDKGAAKGATSMPTQAQQLAAACRSKKPHIAARDGETLSKAHSSCYMHTSRAPRITLTTSLRSAAATLLNFPPPCGVANGLTNSQRSRASAESRSVSCNDLLSLHSLDLLVLRASDE